MGNWKADLSFVARTELDGECAAFLWSFALVWDTLLGQPCQFHWLNLNQDISKLAALPLRSESMGFCIFNGRISPLFACIVPIAKQRGGGNSWLNSYFLLPSVAPWWANPAHFDVLHALVWNHPCAVGRPEHALRKPIQELILLSSHKDLGTCFEVWAQAYVSLTDFLHWHAFLQNVAVHWHLLISLSWYSILCVCTPILWMSKDFFLTLYWEGIRIWKQGSFTFVYFIVHCSF